METSRFYENGEITGQEKKRKTGEKPEAIVSYSNGLPVEERKDRDGDGKMDVFITFDSKGLVSESREVDKKGEAVRIDSFRSGKPVKSVYDPDGDGFLDSVCTYENGHLALQTKDENKDNKPDTWIYFDAQGRKNRIEADTRFSGAVDYRVLFRNGEKWKRKGTKTETGILKHLKNSMFRGGTW